MFYSNLYISCENILGNWNKILNWLFFVDQNGARRSPGFGPTTRTIRQQRMAGISFHQYLHTCRNLFLFYKQLFHCTKFINWIIVIDFYIISHWLSLLTHTTHSHHELRALGQKLEWQTSEWTLRPNLTYFNPSNKFFKWLICIFIS